ncbi:unnamed protein product [Echinostoma caproni]|uniref:Uncharacterized protein n=1 Tax=Echinostoma caproni TaxID=27848 RepID=A0A3P8G830_9TREM|nr:unnamed protein product [Echinostoma caproni]
MREVRLCAAEKDVLLKRSEERIQTLNSQIRSLQSIGDPLVLGGNQATQTLPEHLNEDTSKIIQYLEEHLQFVLTELDDKSQQLFQLDRELDEYRRKFALCRHRQGLLYQDFHTERKAWKHERKNLEDKVTQAEALSGEIEIYKTELARLTETFNQMESGETTDAKDEIKRKMGELVRELTVLRVNEATLVRRFRAAEEREEMFRKENINLKSDLIQLESAVTARLGYYARYKEKTAFQLANLHQSLDRSIPRVDHERLIREYEQMAGKFREQMDRRASASETSSALQRTEEELRKLREQHEALKAQLGIEKERRCVLELQANRNPDKSVNESELPAQSQHIAQRVALLEMKELNERERANHAQAMLDTVKGSIQQLESRNSELETLVSQLTKTALDLQSTEQELRQELAVDLMNHHLIYCFLFLVYNYTTQISEATAIRRLATAQGRASRLENTVLKLEQRLSNVEDERLGQRNYLRQRERRFRDTVNRLRLRFAGCVPLLEQERAIQRLNSLTQERAVLQAQLQEALDAKIACEAQLDSMKERLRMNEEIRSVLSELQTVGGKQMSNNAGGVSRVGALERKISEWQSRLANIRLGESTQRRQAEKLRQQVHHLESLLHTQEAELISLELENSSLAKELDRCEVQWEKREAELEDELVALESGQNAVVQTAISMKAAYKAAEMTPKRTTDYTPDQRLPVSDQLTDALTTLKQYSVQLFDQKVENEGLKKRVAELIHALREVEREHQQSLTPQVNQQLVTASNSPAPSNPVVASLRMNIDLLERRLAAKEESLLKANELLREAHRASEEANERHAKDMAALQAKLHAKMGEALVQLTHAVENAGAGGADQAGKRQGQQTAHLTVQIQELEDALNEQNQVMVKQIEQNKQLQRDCTLWKMRYEQLQTQTSGDKETMEERYR